MKVQSLCGEGEAPRLSSLCLADPRAGHHGRQEPLKKWCVSLRRMDHTREGHVLGGLFLYASLGCWEMLGLLL